MTNIDRERLQKNYDGCISDGNELCAQCGGEIVARDEVYEGRTMPVAGIIVCDAICAIDALDVAADELVAEWTPESVTVEVELRDPRKAKEVRLSMVAEAWARLYPPDDAGVVVIELRPALGEAA